MMKEIVYFAHISDTHIGPTAEYARHGYQSLPAAEHLVNHLLNLPQRPDFVIHTGDIVTNPEPEAYEIAADLFSRLDIPIYYAVGNHDRSVDIKKYLSMGPHQLLHDDLLSYAFTVKGHRFLTIDARAPDELDPHGYLTEAQLQILNREAARPDGPPLTIFVHFPPWPLDSGWMDKYMLMINGREFHNALLPIRHRLRGVFFGHVHQHVQIVRDGILYTSTASPFAQFGAWPTDQSIRITDRPPGYNFVHLMPNQTVIHHHTLDRHE